MARLGGYFRYFVFCWGLVASLSNCNIAQGKGMETGGLEEGMPIVSESVRQSVLMMSGHRILFAHHSVGQNILAGMESIAQETGVGLKIENLDKVSPNKESRIVHFSPGGNTQPRSKIDGFAQKVRQLGSDFVPDVVLLKFCYVDVDENTNIGEIITYYKDTIDALKLENPDIVFAHVTVPLTERPEDIKSRIKRLLGMQVWADSANLARTRFNELLAKTFPEDPLFDLARIESTTPSGNRLQFVRNGNTYYSLFSGYSHDGGHLNTMGRRIVAGEMAVFIAKILATKTISPQ